MIRRSIITFCAAMLGITLLATGAAYAQRGGGAGGGGGGSEHLGGYRPTPPSKVTGTQQADQMPGGRCWLHEAKIERPRSFSRRA